MKKLFKSNKLKNSELNPTPLALPPETPIHTRHVVPQAAQPQQQQPQSNPASRRSTDLTNAAPGDRTTWVVVDSDDTPTHVRPRVDSKPSSIISLPHGASPPVVVGNINSPVPASLIPGQQQQQAQTLPVRSQPPRSPSVNNHPQTTKEPTKRRSGQIFPWPDSRLTEHNTKSAATIDDRSANSQQRPPSTYSIDTRDTHDQLITPKDKDAQPTKPSAGGRLADFFFASSKDTPRQGKSPKELPYDIEEVVRTYAFPPAHL